MRSSVELKRMTSTVGTAQYAAPEVMHTRVAPEAYLRMCAGNVATCDAMSVLWPQVIGQHSTQEEGDVNGIPACEWHCTCM